jgi:hypothetical protein
MDLVLQNWGVREWESWENTLLVRWLLWVWLACGVWMILMAVYVIGNLSLLLRPVVLSIWEKAMEFWHGWRDASDFAAHAYGKGMRDMCTYHSSLLHVSTVENTITLLFFFQSAICLIAFVPAPSKLMPVCSSPMRADFGNGISPRSSLGDPSLCNLVRGYYMCSRFVHIQLRSLRTEG